jgi:hypothetical protein
MPEMHIVESAPNAHNCIGGSIIYVGQCFKRGLDEGIVTKEGHKPIDLLQFTE